MKLLAMSFTLHYVLIGMQQPFMAACFIIFRIKYSPQDVQSINRTGSDFSTDVLCNLSSPYATETYAQEEI